MSTKNAGSPAIDRARQLLCNEITRAMRERGFLIRVRVTRAEGRPAEARFYSHGEHGWQTESQPITDRELVCALDETLEMLSSQAHHDAWSARRQSHADGYDVELKFHPDKLIGRLGDELNSVLVGILFRDQHDSKKDARHAIRTPRPGRG
jgi:hypothetical protein